jgi:hypothetical protein
VGQHYEFLDYLRTNKNRFNYESEMKRNRNKTEIYTVKKAIELRYLFEEYLPDVVKIQQQCQNSFFIFFFFLLNHMERKTG